jgi:smad nuclear-interacting protein 1
MKRSTDDTDNNNNIKRNKTTTNVKPNFGLSGALHSTAAASGTSNNNNTKPNYGISTALSNNSNKNQSTIQQQQQQRPNFKLSGVLAADIRTGNVQQGIIKKHAPPIDSAISTKDKWVLFIFQHSDGDTPSETLYLHRQATYLLGRDEKLCDIILKDPTCSKEHAVIQFRKNGDVIKPYLMDLESTNGTILNSNPIPPARYIELKDNDILTFGDETDYVMKKMPSS